MPPTGPDPPTVGPPQATYLDEQEIVDRFRLTADRAAAEARLERARNATDSSWPDIGHLSPLHPLMEWLADKVLAAVGRNEAPLIVADVPQPVFCVQGLYANGRGQPQLVEWLAITLNAETSPTTSSNPNPTSSHSQPTLGANSSQSRIDDLFADADQGRA